MQLRLDNFIEFRRKLRLSQRQLAKKAGVSHGTIARIESGGGCHEETLGKIADAMGVDIKELTVTQDFDGFAESARDKQVVRLDSFYSVDIISQILIELAEIKRELGRLEEAIIKHHKGDKQ